MHPVRTSKCTYDRVQSTFHLETHNSCVQSIILGHPYVCSNIDTRGCSVELISAIGGCGFVSYGRCVNSSPVVGYCNFSHM